MKNKEYRIPFAGLKQGKHKFEFELDKTFFDSFDYYEFNEVALNLTVVLNRMSTVLEFEMEAIGTVNVNCDLTNEPFDQEIEANLELLVKFGEKFNDDDDEILIIPHGEHQVNIAQYVYEMIVLAVPLKRIHPGVLDGTMTSEALKKLEELQPKESKEKNEDNIDPRWDALKNLLTDK
ncbi:YceD family protein [Eudoraea sp.]|uniref:YceD family protein n=1 Tax=Eudoraea sp. TaxID=1979955 RepID=UPI003C739002